jgi:hypothetical protein
MNHYMDKIALETFIVIDEFDSFYHYDLIELEYGDDWFEQNVDIDIPLLISRREGISPVLDQRKFTNIY